MASFNQATYTYCRSSQGKIGGGETKKVKESKTCKHNLSLERRRIIRSLRGFTTTDKTVKKVKHTADIIGSKHN